MDIDSVQSLCHVRLCDLVDCSTPGFPVHHQLLEPTQTHVHQFSDVIQPFHPLSSLSPPAFNLSQHQGLFVDPRATAPTRHQDGLESINHRSDQST